ncbi:MAG: alpha-amylase family glycosyl hydrolase [Hyphomonadaceae bacterium]|nr:alpha-amylase family glycosyl hydrolase [Hyphomonadaceae bacterium]
MTSESPLDATRAEEAWWKHAVIYQVYPRSFQDSNGDGVGDLAGVIARLDYLVALGVDAVWLSPIFCSPMDDFGYDVSDHTAIDPLFGDMSDFRRLVAEAHSRGLRVILDYIPNHTSDRHSWFKESRAARASRKRDWYVWRDPAPGGGAPNNWVSEFGGSAWTWDEATSQYYYHGFLRSQPDLNWRNPEVVEAMLDVLRFWLDEGVDGFRVDAIHFLFEDESLTDDPPNPHWHEGMPPTERVLRDHSLDQPEVHDAVALMRRLCDSYEDERVLIGEAYLPIERLMAYYGGALDGFHLPFNFHLITTPWTPTSISILVEAYESKLPNGGWPNWVLGNHDRHRIASRVGRDQARAAAMLLLTLRGTPTLYQGDELGMTNGDIAPDQVRDPWELNMPGLGLGRDPVRTPMLWDESPNAGFSAASPWLPLNADWSARHAAGQADDPASILNLYRRLIALRRREPALSLGDYKALAATDQVLAYERRFGARRLGVALNLSGEPAAIAGMTGRVLLSTHATDVGAALTGRLDLAPNEGLLFEFDR